MKSYINPVVTYIPERREFRVSFFVSEYSGRMTVGTCAIGRKFQPLSELNSDAEHPATEAVHNYLNQAFRGL